MLKIVINGRFLTQPITGVQRVARELVTELDRLLHERAFDAQVSLACEPAADASDLGLRHIGVERRSTALKGHFWEQFVLPRMVDGRLLLCLGNTAPFISALGGQRLAVMIHDLSYLTHPKAYLARYRLAHRALLPLLLKQGDPIFTVSNSEAARLRRLAPSKRIVVAANGGWSEQSLDHEIAPSSPRPENGCKRDGSVLYVGSLSRRKNVDRVLRVAVTLAREDGTRTLLLGAGNEIFSPLESHIPSDVAHLVEMKGQVPCLQTLADYYRRASCLLFPSLYEASPLPPIEAMHFGCPVVASAIPSLTERCGPAAMYCDPLDEADIAAAVRKILQEPDLAAGLAAAGHEQAGRFSWRQQARTVLSALTQSRSWP